MTTLDEAVQFLVEFARAPRPSQFSNYGYEIYLRNVIVAFLMDTTGANQHDAQSTAEQSALSVTFLDAAWELCRMGILRPGTIRLGGQATGEATGYTLTQYGRDYISDHDRPIAALIPGRLPQLFQSMGDRFGAGYLQRAYEATRCHRLGAYLAACVMSGAAAESILLAVAIAKAGDEKSVLAAYRSANGRRKVMDMTVGSAHSSLSQPFRSLSGLLAYWRDDASHGMASTISEIEAHEAIVQLLRLSQFVNDNWDPLVN